MMWTEDDEEKYNDLDIMALLLEHKRKVDGNLKSTTYIEEKEVPFTLNYFFNNEIGFYLPQGQNCEHDAKEIVYSDNMGEYIEYVSENTDYFFTIEKCDNNSFNIEKPDEKDFEYVYEILEDEIEMKYLYTLVYDLGKLKVKGLSYKVNVMQVESYIKDDKCQGYIFLLHNNEKSYKLYILSCKKDTEIVYDLGCKIIENMIESYER